MIEYDPNRHWIRDVRHLGTSWTLRRLVRATAITGLYAVVVSVILIRLDFEGRRAISGTFSLLGVILGIVLVFRTNSAYDRWWEGRKLWGALVNHSRNLAIQLDALLPEEDGESRASLDVAGGCERIRKTPIPFSYSVFIKLLILIHAAILPVGLVPEYGYLAIPLVMLIVFALLGLELMASEIEDPFGFDCNDLPTHAMAEVIRSDTRELLGLSCPPRDAAPLPYGKVS